MALKYRVVLVMLMLNLSILFAGQIRVAMAANVSYASKALIETFHALHPEISVQVILGSSGKLTAQIKHGAPFDLFMSADMQYPKRLYDDGLAVEKPVVYAKGTLALFSLKKRDYSSKIFVLQNPDIHKIAIANPKTAPYGRAAKEALKNAKLYQNLKGKFVYGESISQTVAYASTAADIGIIATSALYAPQMQAYKESIHWMVIDTSHYEPIEQGMIILKNAADKREATYFYEFMLSPKAKEILKRYGYKV